MRRDPDSGEVLARGGGPDAHSVLERSGFVPVVRVYEMYHRLPTGPGTDTETMLAARAVARLGAAGVPPECDPVFYTGASEASYVSRRSGRRSGGRYPAATTSDEVAEILAEVTAADDGVLAPLGDVLTATADFHQDLGRPADAPVAQRLRSLATDGLGVIAADLRGVRTDLADRHTMHPGRSVCSGDVPPGAREASATCACPPPPALVPDAHCR
ncbi:hypothetical protein [Streptomyces sp. NPDC088789]|uniref:hypothetical protein n=1 Tax=Streptomyces sp. NPDC088789 TaxID=3365899 RepID=UPI00381B344E